MPRPKTNKETDNLRRMVHAHLRRQSLSAPPMVASAHLDEDALAAFVEGRLGETDSPPVVRHLVACSFCRRITAQLIRLESEVGAETRDAAEQPVPQEDHSRVRRLLAELGERVFPQSADDSVFAYHAPAEDLEPKEEEDGEDNSK